MTDSEDSVVRERDLSCTFCGPGTWSTWDVVTDDGVFFVCDKHHVEMSEAKMIRLERMGGQKTWKKLTDYERRYRDKSL